MQKLTVSQLVGIGNFFALLKRKHTVVKNEVFNSLMAVIYYRVIKTVSFDFGKIFTKELINTQLSSADPAKEDRDTLSHYVTSCVLYFKDGSKLKIDLEMELYLYSSLRGSPDEEPDELLDWEITKITFYPTKAQLNKLFAGYPQESKVGRRIKVLVKSPSRKRK